MYDTSLSTVMCCASAPETREYGGANSDNCSDRYKAMVDTRLNGRNFSSSKKGWEVVRMSAVQGGVDTHY